MTRPNPASSGRREPDSLAEKPRERGARPSREDRREARFRQRAILDLEDGPAREDLDETLFQARESRGGLPTLGRGHR